MCGRYRRQSDKQRIAEMFQVSVGLEELYLDPEDDIAPGSMQPVVVMTQAGERQIERMRWGFKLPDRLLFNARSEGVESARFWAERFRTKRCIVPADAYFEWVKAAKPPRPKYEFTDAQGGPFGMAGLWSPWKNPKTDAWEDSFAILTGEANSVMQPVHDRQPIVLDPREFAEYLAPAERAPVHLLRAMPDSALSARLVAQDRPVEVQTTFFGDL